MHLWVDPLYGDDSIASWFNPNAVPPGNPAYQCSTSDRSPVDVFEPSTGRVLLHVPHPFKTISSAVRYIESLSPGGGVPPLPYTNAARSVVWRHAIIHLLPGYYANNRTGASLCIDNGLPANGESFPIRLPPSVSVQGTSVLNTVLDLKGIGPAFEFGVFVDPTTSGVVTSGHANAVGYDGTDSFIDSVTIIRAATPDILPSWPQVAAIVLRHEVACSPTVSNCVLARNRVGVLVSASDPGVEPRVTHDGTLIINNTFAWNRIGLWNGQAGPLPGSGTGSSLGESKLVVLNNIFDGTLPSDRLPCSPSGGSVFSYNYWPAGWTNWGGASDFEGLASEDMSALIAGVPTNFNAFELALISTPCPFYNSNGAILAVLRPTSVRVGTTNPAPQAALNLAPITGSPGLPSCAAAGSRHRGILYIRDLICHGRIAAKFSQNTEFDGSPLDFRLSPTVVDATAEVSSLPLAPNRPNPLIDTGFSGPFPVTMANGLVQPVPPGSLPLVIGSQSTWASDNWAHDGEGFGNSRINDDPFAPDGIAAADIGADEVGALIVAGYRYGTTAHLDASPASANVMRNDELAYIGPANTTLTPAQEQPFYRSVVGFDLANWPWTFAAESWHGHWKFGLPSLGTSFYRASVADVVPHLLPDVHPWWITLVPTPGLTVWQHCWGTGSYNWILYLDPSASIINPGGTYNGFTGYANPDDPSLPTGPLVDFYYLDGIQAPGGAPPARLFPKYHYWRTTPPVDLYTAPPLTGFDQYGRGGSTSDGWLFPFASTSVSGERVEALRFSLEFSGEDPGPLSQGAKNIQSFMVWIDR